MKTRLVIDGNAVYGPERRKRIEKMDKNESKEIES